MPPAPPDFLADPLDVLRHWASHAPLPSDRIRAATELARAERAREEVLTDEVALWLARRDALDTLPPSQRLAWLLGELGEKEEEGGGTATDEEEGLDLADLLVLDGGGIPAPRDGGTPA